MKRAVIYARYSSDSQRSESIDAQVRACREFCDRQGYHVVKIYADEAKSGTSTTARENYKAMIADAEMDLYDIIIFHKIDRNARNESDYYRFRDTIIDLGKEYKYAAQQSIDSSNEGKLIENNMVGFAAYFSRNLVGEVKKGQRENALKAKHNGGKPPLGYDVDKDGKYVINEQESAAVRLIFERKAIGCTYGQIIKELVKLNIKTKNGNLYSANSLHDILKNVKYIGTYIHGRVTGGRLKRKNLRNEINPDAVIVKDAIPRIISDQLFNQVQEAMKQRASGRHTAKEIYLLSGLIRCACGSAMVGDRLKSKGQYIKYYRCTARKSKLTDCKVSRIRATVLETKIQTMIEEMIVFKKGRKNLVSELQENLKEKQSQITVRHQDLKRLLSQQEKRADVLLDMIADGDNRSKLKYKEVCAQIEDIKHDIKNLSIEAKSVIMPEQVAFALDAFKEKEKSPETLKLMFRTFVKEVIITENIDIRLCFRIRATVVEMRGVEPLSKSPAAKLSTSVVNSLNFALFVAY